MAIVDISEPTKFRRLLIGLTADLGARVGRETADWTYYPTGEVDVITQTQFDTNDAVSKWRKIQHFTDGSQPTVTEG